jgi:hypothetical protein
MGVHPRAPQHRLPIAAFDEMVNRAIGFAAAFSISVLSLSMHIVRDREVPSSDGSWASSLLLRVPTNLKRVGTFGADIPNIFSNRRRPKCDVGLCVDSFEPDTMVIAINSIEVVEVVRT